MAIQKTKKCNMCNRDLDINQFYSNAATKDGLQYYCKECQSITVAEDKPVTQEYALAFLKAKRLGVPIDEVLKKKTKKVPYPLHPRPVVPPKLPPLPPQPPTKTGWPAERYWPLKGKKE